MKQIWLLILLSNAFSQFLDKSDKAIEKLNSVLELASRSQQKVFVDDFTGLN